MLIDADNHTITIRQSWLDTAIRCADRGRRDAFHPIREEGDAAFAGTSMHAAIEQFSRGNLSLDQMEQYATAYATKGCNEGVPQDDGSILPISFKSFDGPNELIYHAGNCTRGWIQDIHPWLVAQGLDKGTPEVKFSYEAFEHRGWTIIMQGTCDWVPDFGNVIIDWKSAGSDYKQKDKQMFAVQPAVYCGAAVNGCFGREFTWPMEFFYGVAIRLKTKARGQIVPVQRTQAHLDWTYRRIRQYVDLYLDLGPDREWPMSDEGNFLCSQKWCPWYDQCRGAHIDRSLDLFGYDAA